jgi:hypothetical protein
MFAPSKVAELGMPEGQPWPSEVHKVVSQYALGFNENINTVEELREKVAIICSLDEAELKTATAEDLEKRGIPRPIS